MCDLSEDEWGRLRIAWQILNPGSWPERGTMLTDAISALESRSLAAKEYDRILTILARYIRHVSECEGVNFITTGSHHSHDNFTPAEWRELEKLAEWERSEILADDGTVAVVWRPRSHRI